MNLQNLGAIDCDMHPVVPALKALVPHLPANWREAVESRGIPGFESNAYPQRAPITARPDWRNDAGEPPAGIDRYRKAVMDRWQLGHAIGNCIYGVHMVLSEDMAVALATAVNDWMTAEWLDADPRMRASIIVPWQNPERAADEIDRCAADRRFVQVLMPVMAEAPLGRRHYWPIYKAAERHGLPIGIHAGSAYRFPVTPVGWPSYYVEDYAAQSLGFQGQLGSLICEGVFSKFPNLKVVMIESGVSWFTPFLWRLTKFWRGTRSEVPWVDRPPIEIARDHIRLTAQPLDAPDDVETVGRIIDQFQSDEMLLFASDYPHWQFDNDEVVPAGLSAISIEKMAVQNPLATYPRLRETRL
ncbi:MAG TPA: amidohydrolase family protein [Kaistia sp.]|nr:amidohydrolase family protein [Kaistia sp.]